jgi:hypothetical protein
MMLLWSHIRIGGGGALLALTLLSGCSSYESLFGTKPPAASTVPSTTSSTASTSSSSSFTQRFNNLLLGTPATTAAAEGAGPPQPEIDCPRVDIRQGASTFSQSGSDNGALSLRYQANFVKTARECALRGGNVTMKVGVQGRIILGPAGVPGPVALPIRFAVVKEGLEPKTIWTKFYMLPVDMPAGQPNVLFTHVEEDMTVPMPPSSEFDKYVIYVGFDPEGATLEQKKKPTKPAPKAKR